MKAEKMIVNMPPDQPKAEIIIRELTTVNELPIKEPIAPDVKGSIGTVYEWLFKRNSEKDQVNQVKCHCLVDRVKMSILLITHEDEQYLRGEVKGYLKLNPKIGEFGINTGKAWTPLELGQFMKMNRASFSNRAANMDLVNKLKGFEADVKVKIEKSQKENASFSDNYSGVVTSNVPGNFDIMLPIFQGDKDKQTFEVEVYAVINGKTVLLQLYSPALLETIETTIDEIIDKQLDLIRDLCPNIAIIEEVA